MKKKYYSSLLVLIGFVISVNATEIKFNSAKTTHLQIVENSYSVLKLTNTINTVAFESIHSENGDYTKLTLPSYGKSLVEGSPQLPVYKTLIEIPLGSEIDIEVLENSIQEIHLSDWGIIHPVLPAQPPISKEIDRQKPEFQKNENVYAVNEFFGDELVSVEILGTMRGVHIARLEIAPIKYNPVLNDLLIYDDLDIEIKFKNADISQTKMIKENFFSPFFESIYSSFYNYKPSSGDELIMNAPITYIIVADPMFESSLQPFVEWKTKKGFQVIEAYTNDPSVGTSTESIKSYLENFYNEPPAGYHPQSFILLVGDVPQIPAFTGSFGFHSTDLYYAEYTGDLLPDCYYGRFSANDVSELMPQIDKTLEYERFEFPEPAYLDSALLVAGVAAGIDTIWGNGQIDYAANHYINEEHGIFPFIYPQPEPSGLIYSELIAERFNNGLSYFNYTGHCSTFGFIDPAFTIGHVFQLSNVHKYPLVVGNCCSSASFSMNCFGEQIVRAEEKGALCFIGASNLTYWDEDFWWAVGFKNIVSNPQYDPEHLGYFDRWFYDHNEPTEQWFVTQGQFQVAGNLAVAQSGSSIAGYYWEVYHTLGDPSTTIYLPQPELPVVDHAAYIATGSTSFQVTTEPYLYVALSKNGELIGAAVSDEAGLADIIFLEPLLQPGSIEIVITGQNSEPYFGTIPAIITHIEEASAASIVSNLRISPNPFQDEFRVHYNLNAQSDLEVVIINTMGQVMKELERFYAKPAGNYEKEYSVKDMPPGMYYCLVKTLEGFTVSKLIKTE